MIEMFGAEPVRRFALANEFYRSSPWHDEQSHLAAFVGDVLVGVCVCSPPGRCRICTDVDPDRPPDDPLQGFEWQFDVNVQAAHAGHRVNFFVACGFYRVRTFPDLAGPDAILMRAELRAL
jgi:hypothetical protein